MRVSGQSAMFDATTVAKLNSMAALATELNDVVRQTHGSYETCAKACVPAFSAWYSKAFETVTTQEVETKFEEFMKNLLTQFGKGGSEMNPVVKVFRNRAMQELAIASPRVVFEEVQEGDKMRAMYPGPLYAKQSEVGLLNPGTKYACVATKNRGKLGEPHNDDFVEIKFSRPENGGPPLPPRQEGSTRFPVAIENKFSES